MKAFVEGVTAAATGAIAGAASLLGRRAIFAVPIVPLALGTLAILIYASIVPEPLVIAVAGILGHLVWTAGGR